MDKLPRNKALGAAIYRARAASGLSLKQVAMQTGMSKSTVSYIEQGIIGAPDPNRLTALAVALSIEPAPLLKLAGYDLTASLPEFTPYMRSKYKHLPKAAQDELATAFQRVSQKYGYDPAGPGPGDDE